MMDYYQMEDNIIDHQMDLIKEKFGTFEAEHANYGWGVDEQPAGPVVETKIYGPRKVLTTRMNLDKSFEDEWSDIG